MYARRFSHNFAPPQHNLRNVVSLERCSDKNLFKYNLMIRRQYSVWENQNNIKDQLHLFMEKAQKCRKLLFLKSNPEKTLKMWARQFEFILAQRVRRGQQMLCLYSRWWEEKALKEFFKRLRISLSRNGREFIIGALGVAVYNWEEKRIPDNEFEDHLNDLSYINTLKEATMCLACAKGELSNNNTSICECRSGGITKKSIDHWVPFIEKDDLVVWRRPHGEGLFEYKVYGSYKDVSAEDFLNTQIDTDYRKEWDNTAVKLEIGERESDSNSDILYWEMQWPSLFVNRDYVFNRRYKVFEDANTIIIINKTTEYPRFPKYPDKYRVEEYWSRMVIKPYKEINQLGIEFSLTYFDNPGVNIPASVTTWVAKSAMPNYLAKLRHASKNYKQYCSYKGVSKFCEIYRKEDRREEEECNKLEFYSNEKLREILRDVFEEFRRKAIEKWKLKREFLTSGHLERISESAPSLPNDEEQPQQQPNNSTKQDTFWKYLHPMYYFT
ncbi:stAR-related lipid transfer protein 7, mitochondrial-like [Euwallacea fornicatus]|uniref:stAR-related lipid transfer protein 7, mitochondrial-like n=1 Tax=Euwallacea fornicatus TaxID=995702 RepID=UPI00338F78CB